MHHENMEIPKYPKLPEGKDKRKKLTPKDIAKIRALKAKGHSDRVIAKEMKVNHTTIRYWTGDKERQLAKTMRRLKAKPPSKEVIKERRIRNRNHTFEIIGVEIMRKFRRDHRKATRHLYVDYRKVCENPECPGRTLSKDGTFKRGHRYSSRLHKVCPICKK